MPESECDGVGISFSMSRTSRRGVFECEWDGAGEVIRKTGLWISIAPEGESEGVRIMGRVG